MIEFWTVDALALRGLFDGPRLSVSVVNGWTVTSRFAAESIMASLELILSMLRLEWLSSFCDESLRREPTMMTCVVREPEELSRDFGRYWASRKTAKEEGRDDERTGAIRPQR